MTRAEKIEAAAERMMAATDGVEWFGVAIGATSLDMERSRSILGARMALRAALAAPASPGPRMVTCAVVNHGSALQLPHVQRADCVLPMPVEPPSASPGPQVACDKCSVGVMDAENPHVRGACRCACHGPASPGPRAMEEIERLLDRALSIGLKDAKVSGWREDVLSAIRRAPGSASPGERGPSLPPQTYEDGFRECRVAAECCVEAEEELSGPMPEAMLSALRERPEDVLRATVRTTKDGILARVQALRPMLAAPAAPPESSPDDAARWVKALNKVGLPVPPGFEKAMRAAPPESSGEAPPRWDGEPPEGNEWSNLGPAGPVPAPVAAPRCRECKREGVALTPDGYCKTCFLAGHGFGWPPREAAPEACPDCGGEGESGGWVMRNEAAEWQPWKCPTCGGAGRAPAGGKP